MVRWAVDCCFRMEIMESVGVWRSTATSLSSQLGTNLSIDISMSLRRRKLEEDNSFSPGFWRNGYSYRVGRSLQSRHEKDKSAVELCNRL